MNSSFCSPDQPQGGLNHSRPIRLRRYLAESRGRGTQRWRTELGAIRQIERLCAELCPEPLDNRDFLDQSRVQVHNSFGAETRKPLWKRADVRRELLVRDHIEPAGIESVVDTAGIILEIAAVVD